MLLFPDFGDILIVSVFLGLIPAFIAQSKGRPFLLWYIYGIALFIVALIHSIVIQKSEEKKNDDLKSQGYTECPFCKELVKPGATVCPHCQRNIQR